MRRPQITLKQLFIWTLLYALLLSILLLLPNSLGASSVSLAVLSLALLGDGYRCERSQRDKLMSASYYSFVLSLALAVALGMAFVFPPPSDAMLRTHESQGDPLRDGLVVVVRALLWVFGYIFFWWFCSTISFVGAILRCRRFRLAKWLTFLNAPAIVLLILYVVGTAFEALGELTNDR